MVLVDISPLCSNSPELAGEREAVWVRLQRCGIAIFGGIDAGGASFGDEHTGVVSVLQAQLGREAARAMVDAGRAVVRQAFGGLRGIEALLDGGQHHVAHHVAAMPAGRRGPLLVRRGPAQERAVGKGVLGCQRRQRLAALDDRPREEALGFPALCARGFGRFVQGQPGAQGG